MNSEIASFLIEGLTEDVVARIVTRDEKPFSEAACAFLNSQTYAKLSDTLTGLYIESPSYIYAMYKDEIRDGRLTLGA